MSSAKPTTNIVILGEGRSPKPKDPEEAHLTTNASGPRESARESPQLIIPASHIPASHIPGSMPSIRRASRPRGR